MEFNDINDFNSRYVLKEIKDKYDLDVLTTFTSDGLVLDFIKNGYHIAYTSNMFMELLEIDFNGNVDKWFKYISNKLE